MRDDWLARQARKIAEQAPYVPTQYIDGGSVADYGEAYQQYRSEVVRERRREASPERLYVRFDGPPSHDSGRFVELETEAGRSVGPEESGAHWYLQDDGTWLLGPFARAEEEAGG